MIDKRYYCHTCGSGELEFQGRVLAWASSDGMIIETDVPTGDDCLAYYCENCGVVEGLPMCHDDVVCGHSACSQHYIDTGDRSCIQDTPA